jgi:hypothetical protein
MISTMIPLLIMQLGFAPLHLDDGHTIKAKFVQSGTVAPFSGWMVQTGDIADIQASLTGNSCLIRLSEIKKDFEDEIRLTQSRCAERMKVIQDSLDESKKLNETLKQQLESEKQYSNRLLIGSVATGAVLTAATLFLSFK